MDNRVYKGQISRIFVSLFLNYERKLLKTVDIRSPKTVISVHFSYSLPMAMQIY